MIPEGLRLLTSFENKWHFVIDNYSGQVRSG